MLFVIHPKIMVFGRRGWEIVSGNGNIFRSDFGILPIWDVQFLDVDRIAFQLKHNL